MGDSGSEMETDQDVYADTEGDKVNNNRTSGTPLDGIARRASYMQLRSKIEEIQEADDVGLHAAQKVFEVLQGVKKLDEECCIKDRLDKVDEFVMDAHILNSANEVVIKCINAMELNVSTYNPAEFVDRIKESMKSPLQEEFQNKDILKLIKDARKIVRQVPHYGFLYGAYDPSTLPDAKQRKERKRGTLEVKEKLQKKTLEKIVRVSKEELSVDEIVNHQKKVLEEEFINNNYQPINYYRFVVDTDSFSATVENMFYFSFLIQNGSAALLLDDEQPVIKPVSKKRKDSARKEGEANIQMIASICEDEWKELKIGTGFLQRRKMQILCSS